jgi:hypothetical protein
MADKPNPLTEKEAEELRERYSSAGETFIKMPMLIMQVGKDLPRIMGEWERLRSELEQYKSQLRKCIEVARTCESKGKSLEKRVARLESALRPFANYKFNPADEEGGHIGLVVKIDDLKRARTLLKTEG